MHTLTRDGRRPEFRPAKESEMLLSKYREGGARDLLVLHNKSPQWNEGAPSPHLYLIYSFFNRNSIVCTQF